MKILIKMSTIGRSYCTTLEAAKILGVSVRTAQLWVEKGILEAWKTEGGHRRISRASVERLCAKSQSTAPSRNLDRFKILVVEDNRMLQRLYEAHMANWPMLPRVIQAENGIEALVLIGKEKPDLLISDLSMPEMDGFSMIRVLRQMPEVGAMEIVVVSALNHNEINAKGGLPEGIPVFGKPIPFADLEKIALRVASSKLTSAVN